MPPIELPQKTVYVLGAGFSAPAGGPSQEKLMKLILDFPEEREQKAADAKSKLSAYLKDALNVPFQKREGMALEDLYTPIDRCLADGLALRGKSTTDLIEVRNALDYLIAAAIKKEFEDSAKDKAYVYDFARNVVKHAAHRAHLAKETDDASAAKAYDPISVISLNWDILLDNALHSSLEQQDRNLPLSDYGPFGVVDYCCYVSSVDRNDRRIRTGLWSLGSRGYNVKLLKLHGSMNWLQCTNCQRLYTSFNVKSILSNRIDEPCRHCKKHDTIAKLRGTLVMPTFLKDLSNFQLKLVWQNAGVELMEATKLVFIGYSLPHADFEFRQLLSRMIKRRVPIEVVLWGQSDNYLEELKRYQQFFAGHPIDPHPEGVGDYVRDHLPVPPT